VVWIIHNLDHSSASLLTKEQHLATTSIFSPATIKRSKTKPEVAYNQLQFQEAMLEVDGRSTRKEQHFTAIFQK
jgi:hypothetical protein